jgi:hypothetical protein
MLSSQVIATTTAPTFSTVGVGGGQTLMLIYYVCGLMGDLLHNSGDKSANVTHLGFKPDRLHIG